MSKREVSRALPDYHFGYGEYNVERLPLCWTCRAEPVQSFLTFKHPRGDGNGFLEWRRATATTCARKTCVDVHAWVFGADTPRRSFVGGFDFENCNPDLINIYWLMRYLRWLANLNKKERRTI